MKGPRKGMERTGRGPPCAAGAGGGAGDPSGALGIQRALPGPGHVEVGADPEDEFASRAPGP